MNVAELKEALDDYGDHLPVVVVIATDKDDHAREQYEVSYSTDPGSGEPVVTIEVTL